MLTCVFFFFKQKTAYEMRISDWSSDVCSSDLEEQPLQDLRTLPAVIGKQRRAFCKKAQDCVGFGKHAAVVHLQQWHFAIRVHGEERIGARRSVDDIDFLPAKTEIGRASCRERVCQYV